MECKILLPNGQAKTLADKDLRRLAVGIWLGGRGQVGLGARP